MKKHLILSILLIFSALTASADRESDRRQAEKYDKEAEYYQRKADGYYREAEDYRRKAMNHLNDAQYYLKNGNVYNSISATDRARSEIRSYESKTNQAKSAERTAQDYRKRAERLRR
ncbi:MAG: hypothetical protein ACI30M_03100 [Muribaculaceae bacterium]